jgi:hypothetical protein
MQLPVHWFDGEPRRCTGELWSGRPLVVLASDELCSTTVSPGELDEVAPSPGGLTRLQVLDMERVTGLSSAK